MKGKKLKLIMWPLVILFLMAFWLSVGLIAVALTSNKASAVDLSRWGGSIGVYHVVNKSPTEYGDKIACTASLHYKLQAGFKLEYLHKSYCLLGEPIGSREDSESTFDSIGIKWEF